MFFTRNPLLLFFALLCLSSSFLWYGCVVEEKEDPGASAKVTLTFNPTESESYRQSGNFIWESIMILSESGGLGGTIGTMRHEWYNARDGLQPFFSYDVPDERVIEVFGGKVLPAKSSLVGVWPHTRATDKNFWVKTIITGVDNNGNTWSTSAWFHGL